MNCEKTRLMFPDYADGFISPNDRNLVDEHLSVCATCRTDIAETISLIETARGVEIGSPSGAFWKIQYENLLETHRNRSGMRRLRRRIEYGFGLTLMLIFVLFAGRISTPKRAYVYTLNPLAETISLSPVENEALLPTENLKRMADYLEPEDQAFILASLLR